jgi:4-hydroxy-tetrahydrodipicolinate synthase
VVIAVAAFRSCPFPAIGGRSLKVVEATWLARPLPVENEHATVDGNQQGGPHGRPSGVLVACVHHIPTPTTDDGETVDQRALCQVIDHQIEQGVHGICVLGSTGGNGSFREEEMRSATETAAKHAAGRISVIAGTGARTTSECIALSRHAQEVGCDGVMILPVSYWPLTLDEVFAHYERVCAAIDIPMCVYNNPWTTGVDMKPEFLARLTALNNVSCIKESTGDLTRITAIRLLTQDKVTIVAGWESSSLQAFMAGATG